MKKLYAVLAVLLLFASAAGLLVAQNFPGASGNPSVLSRPGGDFYAPGFFWQGRIVSGYQAAGTNTVQIMGASGGAGGLTLSDGSVIPLQAVFSTLTPLVFDWGQGNAETVTPTAVSVGACSAGNLGVGGSATCANFTGVFANAHGQSAVVVDASYGLQTAVNYAFSLGGGLVKIDPAWAQMGGTNALINGAIAFGPVSIQDTRTGQPRYWAPTPTGAALAVPATLTAQAACDATHQFCSDASVAGSASYAGGTLYGCVAYVDIAGNEGPCSLTANFTDVSAKAIDIASPAASPGAVGWVPYLSLDGGTYAQAYQIPVTSSVCTMTTLETVTPACAVANSTFGQSASTFGKNALFNGGAQITGYPVNTGLHFTKLASVAMTAASQTPVSNSSVSYAYAPSSRVGACPGMSSANVVNYAASGSSATTVPNAIATWTIPANCFNYIGAEFRVSGKFTYTDGGDTSTNVYVKWDAAGTNSTTVGTTLCNMADTATGTAAAYNGNYSCTVRIATTGATGTALVNGYSAQSLAAGATTLVRNTMDIGTAATSSINLTVPARIAVYFIGTGATNNPGAQGLAATLEVLN